MQHTVRDWERRVCPNERCTVETLVVKQWPGRHDIWWVASQEADAPWTEASTVPVCPFCGETLRVAAASSQDTSGLMLDVDERSTLLLSPTRYAAHLAHAREAVSSPSA